MNYRNILENTFAAEAFTSANLHRQAVELRGGTATAGETLENVFAATAYAEAGDRDTALSLAPGRPASGFRAWLEDIFVAASFAQGGDHDTALHVMGVTRPQNSGRRFEDFLQTIGLDRVPVHYGLATVHA